MADKQYCGNGKTVNTKYGEIVAMGLKFDDLPPPNEKGYINLVLAKRKEVSESGQTHVIYVNDWKPEQKQGGEPEKGQLPF